MERSYKGFIRTAVIVGFILILGGVALAQNPPATQGQAAPPATTDKDKLPASSSLSLDVPAPANAEEDEAYKAFSAVPQADPKKKIELGEAFAQKYPTSRYLSPVYSVMTTAYMVTNDVKKMEEIGDKEAVLNPNDVQVLAVLGQTIPRAISSSTPNPSQELEKAEKYSRRAIEVTPTVTKPENLTDAQFDVAKNQILAMAHGGLGLVSLRRGKYAEAIPELETSIKIDPAPDPVNIYLLGMANQRSSHFDDAISAYTKCAATQNPMQAACKTGVEEAKKAASTQLSAPK